jgi:iron(III) transport system permease protein
VAVTLLGFLIAYTVERTAVPGRDLLALLIQVPYAVPGIVVAIAAILLLLRPLPLLHISLYGTSAIIVLAYIARFLAVAVGPISAQISQLDRDLEAAAMLCGAGLVQRLRHIVGPIMLPALAVAHLLVMLLAFNELTVSALLWSAGTETLGVALLSLEDAGLIGPASALALATIVIIAVLIILIDQLGRSLPPGALPWATLCGLADRR